jgi:hypothetical protein
MGLFEIPTNLASVGQIEVIHHITYLSAPFGSVADPMIYDKLYELWLA